MSQVIVTDDALKEKRARTGRQEKTIDRESGFNSWRRNDVTKLDLFQKLFGYAVYPIVALWGLLVMMIYGVVQIFKALMGAVGKILSSSKD